MCKSNVPKFRAGDYDENGHWQRHKFCFMYCGPERCDCGPPLGKYQLTEEELKVWKSNRFFGGDLFQ